MKIIPKIKPTLLNVGSHIFFNDRGTLFPRLRGSWQDSQGRRSTFGKEIGNSETLLPRFRSTPFRFKPLNLVTILCQFTYREPVTGNAIFRVYICGIVRFLSFDNGRSSRIGGGFFSPFACFFFFISLFETRIFFLWNLLVPYFFEIFFLRILWKIRDKIMFPS